ncbi:CGNR zinc finger domain-containing protein [Streptomyces sp. NPDC059373]
MDLDPALELASTIHHDGDGGVADDLADAEGLTVWVRERAEWLGVPPFDADDRARAEVVAVREAVRALFARAVSPGPPSRADANRLLPADEAVARLNAAAARQPVTVSLAWPDGAEPEALLHPAGPAGAADPVADLTATLARAAVDFLTGPQRERLRACAAPRCVRYFVKAHGRQEWCKPSCGNRARVARHYRRHRAPSENSP